MSELIVLAAIVCSAVGAILSTVKGWWDSPEDEKYSGGKLASSLIISIFASFTVVNLASLPEDLGATGWTGLAITYLLLGFGADTALSKLDK